MINKYSAKVFDGNKLATKIRQTLKSRIISKQIDSKPYLGYIIVGDLQ